MEKEGLWIRGIIRNKAEGRGDYGKRDYKESGIMDKKILWIRGKLCNIGRKTV